jgi:lysophospholipase L1-like esterase
MDIYNPFVAEDIAAGDFAILNGYLTQVNDIIHSTAGIAPYAKVYAAFNINNNSIVDPRTKDLLSVDGFHPNTRGHALIATKLAELGYASIVP